jgi:dolichol kinase
MSRNKTTQTLVIPNELGRKSLHIITVLVSFLLVEFIVPWTLIALFTATFIIVYIFDKLGYLHFFHNVSRKSYGHYFMAAGVFGVLLLHELTHSHNSLIFAFAVLGICDPLAVLGRPTFNYLTKFKSFNWLHKLTFGGKTPTGSAIFYLSALAIACLIGIFIVPTIFTLPHIIYGILGIFGLTMVEYWSIWGLDNFTLPVCSYLFFLFLM